MLCVPAVHFEAEMTTCPPTSLTPPTWHVGELYAGDICFSHLRPEGSLLQFYWTFGLYIWLWGLGSKQGPQRNSHKPHVWYQVLKS